jgi:hypothetical protein
MDRSGVTDVRTVPNVRDHWRRDHAGQFVIDRAEGMMASVLDDPLKVVQAKKDSTLLFVGDFTETSYLVIPVKCLPVELWVGTMFTFKKSDFDNRGWVKKGILYERE